MKNFREYTIYPNSSIKSAFNKLSETCDLGLVVIDETDKLLGTLTDGDLRRALLNGASLESEIGSYINKTPLSVGLEVTSNPLNSLTEDLKIKIVPVVESDKVVGIYTANLDEILDTNIVIMAGGLGSRLGELTSNCPKPMLDVGGKPVLEHIINNFTKVGFKNIYISVNYMSNIIMDYFKDGSDFGCNIAYLEENTRLGTAGALSLLPESAMDKPVIVTNGDLLTPLDFRLLSWFHISHKATMTVCTRRYEFQVPYGVVNLEDNFIKSVDEKPVQGFNVSAGVYMLEPSLIKEIPKDTFYDMPTLINCMLSKNQNISCFPMYEEWIDIGKVEDLDFAREVYGSSK